MALIFDQFPNRERADAFAAAVTEKFGRESVVYDNVDDADAADPFPFPLDGPVVHVWRYIEGQSEDEIDKGMELEPQITRLVRDFDGVFAGT